MSEQIDPTALLAHARRILTNAENETLLMSDARAIARDFVPVLLAENADLRSKLQAAEEARDAVTAEAEVKRLKGAEG